MDFTDFWYIAALSEEVGPRQPVASKVLGEWLVLFRDEQGKAVALRDRCMHRAGRLSEGRACQGRLQCPYHGWTYNGVGEVVAVPSEGEEYKALSSRRTTAFPVVEQDGLLFVRLNPHAPEDLRPFPMPHYQEKGWSTVRLINRFANNVTNCTENFIDVPHTVSVHPGIFRTARGQKVEAAVTRSSGEVRVEYRGETSNLGWFSWFLNPGNQPIGHTDAFIMPNVTQVVYTFPQGWSYIITSQSVPCEDDDTLVYTDLTYRFGPFNYTARPIVSWLGQRVIDQDVVALRSQMEVIRKYGDQFQNTSADVIHVFLESIRNELASGRDPRLLPHRSVDVTFRV